MLGFRSAELIDDGAAVALIDNDGARTRFHAVWLRDNALDRASRSPDNGQRLIRLADIPADTKLVSASLCADQALDQALHVVFEPGGKAFSFPARWLREHTYDNDVDHDRAWMQPYIETWDGQLETEPLTAHYDQVCTDSATLAQWLRAVRNRGFAILRGGPKRSGALLNIVALFGFVRETNYGKWFDVKAQINPSNLAYTGLGLQAHTDNPYRDPTPTLQILYCLENAVSGGDSFVVDGFRAVERLKQASPQGLELLSGHCARFSYRGTGNVCLTARRPMIELAPDGELTAVRFNNRSCAPITDVPYTRMADYYAAYRHFADIIDDPGMAVSFKLAPGESFIVDNTRVLHARKPYDGTGNRWLQGCYADKDGLLSTLDTIDR